MANTHPQRGIADLTLPQKIDRVANESPTEIYGWTPRSDWMNSGWEPITFGQVSRAVDYLSWSFDNKLGMSKQFDTLTYIGPHDFRFAFVVAAAAKTRRRFLFPDSTLKPPVLCSLLEVINCESLVCTEETKNAYGQLKEGRPSLKLQIIPSLNELLALGVEVRPYSFDPTFEEVAKDPLVILHTSGTTGRPKPVVYTHESIRKLPAYGRISRAKGENTLIKLLAGGNLLLTTPLNFATGLYFAALWPAEFRIRPVLPPTDIPRPYTTATIAQILDFGPDLEGAMFSTMLLRDCAKKSDMLSRLAKVKLVGFAGASLEQWAGDTLSQYTRVYNGLGSTETGPVGTVLGPKELWAYHRFMPDMGYRMDPQADGLSELVLERKGRYLETQIVFDIFPGIEEFRTKDLYRPHPEIPEYWLHCGRADDLIKNAAMDKIHTEDIESLLDQLPSIRGTLIGGSGKVCPFVLAEIDQDLQASATNAERAKIWEELWAKVQNINSDPAKKLHIPKELVLLVDPSRPLPRTGNKDTIKRREALALYEPDIEAAYTAWEKR